MLIPQDQMLLASAKFKFLLCSLSVIKRHRQGGWCKENSVAVHLCSYIALSGPQVSARLVDMGRKQELLPPAPNPSACFGWPWWG